jgi:hypothetical protein
MARGVMSNSSASSVIVWVVAGGAALRLALMEGLVRLTLT